MNSNNSQFPTAIENDATILALIAKPETVERGFRLLLQTYQSRLYSALYHILQNHEDTDEVLQNTFIKVYKHIANFRQESQLYTWLYRIATNESLTFLKQKKRANTISIHTIEYQLSKSLESDTFFTGDRIQLKLQQAILTLPEKQRIVFNMRYYDETPYEQMSEILETSVGALKASYHIAAKKIEEHLKSN